MATSKNATRVRAPRAPAPKTRTVRASSSLPPVRRAPAAPKPSAKVLQALKRPAIKPRLPDGHLDNVVRIVGIDPGEHTGMAFFDDGALVRLSECKPEQLPVVLRNLAPMVALVVFEDSRLAKTVWTGEGSRAKRDKMARNVGEIDAWCRLIQATCELYGIPCMGLPPSAKAGNARGAKLNAAQFKAFTGWAEPSNQHNRDAALIAWPYRKARP